MSKHVICFPTTTMVSLGGLSYLDPKTKMWLGAPFGFPRTGATNDKKTARLIGDPSVDIISAGICVHQSCGVFPESHSQFASEIPTGIPLVYHITLALLFCPTVEPPFEATSKKTQTGAVYQTWRNGNRRFGGTENHLRNTRPTSRAFRGNDLYTLTFSLVPFNNKTTSSSDYDSFRQATREK